MNLSNSFNVSARDGTRLTDPVKNGNAEIVKQLLDLGADLNTFSPLPPVAATTSGPRPQKPNRSPSATQVTEMATTRQLKAPETARFKKKTPPKRKTTL